MKDQPSRFVFPALMLGVMGAIALAPKSPAQTLTTLYSFCNQEKCLDGREPYGGLVQAEDGDLWGTTQVGGAHGGAGTVFKITPRGTLATVYSFCAQSDCMDGVIPTATLALATNGDLYGTTNGRVGDFGFSGTVFKITSTALVTLDEFCPQVGCVTFSEGPYPGLVQATNGDLYGTEYYGGAYGGGIVYKVTPAGALTTVHTFCAQSTCTDGKGPDAGLVQAVDGDLYGTTLYGGAYGGGTVFKMTPEGVLITLYSFCALSACPLGEGPSSLVQATNGDLYGTTFYGGANDEGTVFKVAPGGTLTTLYSFGGPSADQGIWPHGGLVQATDGELYGITLSGGAHGEGTVFKITLSGAFTSLYSFCAQSGCSDGAAPYSALVQATNGALYGTTSAYGANGDGGTVFRLSVGLDPFVETLPTSGGTGTAVTILGNYLAGASGISFNGTAAPFTVVSASAIKTTVPAGATTGRVEVTTPNGTLSSNLAFRVPQ